jgi:hypothetical protein
MKKINSTFYQLAIFEIVSGDLTYSPCKPILPPRRDKRCAVTLLFKQDNEQQQKQRMKEVSTPVCGVIINIYRASGNHLYH